MRFLQPQQKVLLKRMWWGAIAPAVALIAVPASADNPFLKARDSFLLGAQKKAGVGPIELEGIVGNLIKGALSIVGVVFFAFMVWAGYLWMTAAGEEEKITKAKKMLNNSIIGLAITLAAYAITNFVMNALMKTGVMSQ